LQHKYIPDLVHKFPALSDITHTERKLIENCILLISSYMCDVSV